MCSNLAKRFRRCHPSCAYEARPDLDGSDMGRGFGISYGRKSSAGTPELDDPVHQSDDRETGACASLTVTWKLYRHEEYHVPEKKLRP